MIIRDITIENVKKVIFKGADERMYPALIILSREQLKELRLDILRESLKGDYEVANHLKALEDFNVLYGVQVKVSEEAKHLRVIFVERDYKKSELYVGDKVLLDNHIVGYVESCAGIDVYNVKVLQEGTYTIRLRSRKELVLLENEEEFIE